jgi:hypothetical protein
VRPLRVYVSDKEQLNQHVRARLGEAFNVPTIAIPRTPAEARAFDFPARCVIKPAHMSGAVNGEAVKVGELTNCPFNALFPFASRESEELATRIIYG